MGTATQEACNTVSALLLLLLDVMGRLDKEGVGGVVPLLQLYKYFTLFRARTMNEMGLDIMTALVKTTTKKKQEPTTMTTEH